MNTRLSFTSKVNTMGTTVFSVVSFSGTEHLSELYSYEITLASRSTFALKALLNTEATILIDDTHNSRSIHGVIAEAVMISRKNDVTYYRVILMPRLWRSTLSQYSQIFLNKSLPKIIQSVLIQAGLPSTSFTLSLQEDYPAYDFVCQYCESFYDFLDRWLRRLGISYFFIQEQDEEKLVITDSHAVYQSTPNRQLPYRQPSALTKEQYENVVYSLYSQKKITAGCTKIYDFNYEKPDLDLVAESKISNGQQTVNNYFGEHLRSIAEATHRSTIRQQETLCNQQTFIGKSTCPTLAAGSSLTLSDHNWDTRNTTYTITSVSHKGSNKEFDVAGFDNSNNSSIKTFYRNEFTAITADTLFRPSNTTPWPKIAGYISAKIDSAANEENAELDSLGRYKVIFPFDLSGKKDGKASHRIRFVQPYSADQYGFHFPLHKGTEVLISFENGDPDRPVIIGAVPNIETPTPVDTKNNSRSILRSAGSNELSIDDLEQNQKIHFTSPDHKAKLRIGKSDDNSDGIHIASASGVGEFVGNNKSSAIMGNEHSTILLGKQEIQIGSHDEVTTGRDISLTIGPRIGLNIPKERVNIAPNHIELMGMVVEKSCKKNIKAADNKIKLVNSAIRMIDKKSQETRTLIRLVNEHTHKGKDVEQNIDMFIQIFNQYWEKVTTEKLEMEAPTSKTSSDSNSSNASPINEIETVRQKASKAELELEEWKNPEKLEEFSATGQAPILDLEVAKDLTDAKQATAVNEEGLVKLSASKSCKRSGNIHKHKGISIDIAEECTITGGFINVG